MRLHFATLLVLLSLLGAPSWAQNLTSVSFSPATVTGGANTTGTLTLDAPATVGNNVTLTSSNTAALYVPPTAYMSVGVASRTFTAISHNVTAVTTVTVTATYNSVSKTATVTVNPAPVYMSSVAFSPSTVTGGASTTGTLTLTGPAPAGNAVVNISGDNTAALFVPPTAQLNAGLTSRTFVVVAHNVTTPQTVTVTATYNGVSKTATVTVLAPPVLSLTAAVNGQSSLNWTSISNAASYNLYRSTTSGSGYTKIAPNIATTTYLDQGLTNGVFYYYVVTSVTSTGTESSYSNQVTSQPTAQAFGFLNVGNGSVLSGQVTLSVSMASQAYGSDQNLVTFSVDGTVYDTGGDQQESSGNAGANTFFVLDTNALANGSHTLNVKDVNGNSASVNVTFSNVLSNLSIPSMFDTSGGDGLPTSATITASLTSAQPWTVSIITVDSASSTVQSFSGNSATINVSWNGNNSQGVEAPDDAYEVDIAYGTPPVTKGSVRTPGAPPPGLLRHVLSKNKKGDCFVFLDQDVFPSGYAAMIAYLKAIKTDLAPSKGNVWNKFSFVIHTTNQPDWTTSEIQRIDNHFKMPLTVFYVDAHGGPISSDRGTGTQFKAGEHWWMSNTYSDPEHSAMATLTQSANYGVSSPPALVFIDSCDSAGVDQLHQEFGFSDDFGIGDGSSGFIGWAGFAVAYGSPLPPHDDWTFWRLDLWSQFTNVNQTYDTAYSNLQNDYNNHGHNLQGGYGYPDAAIVVNWLPGTSF